MYPAVHYGVDKHMGMPINISLQGFTGGTKIPAQTAGLHRDQGVVASHDVAGI
jgi:hypothetical protein